jgi:hypothetical protein
MNDENKKLNAEFDEQVFGRRSVEASPYRRQLIQKAAGSNFASAPVAWFRCSRTFGTEAHPALLPRFVFFP